MEREGWPMGSAGASSSIIMSGKQSTDTEVGGVSVATGIYGSSSDCFYFLSKIGSKGR